MKTRILEFLKTENKSSAQFADEIGVQPSSISHIISGRNNPSLDFVMKMLNKYPSLSTDWLIFGRGQMYREKLLNDLFSSEPKVPFNENADNQEDKFKLQNENSFKETSSTNDRKPESNPNELKRIVFFFDDGTFKEYFPG